MKKIKTREKARNNLKRKISPIKNLDKTPTPEPTLETIAEPTSETTPKTTLNSTAFDTSKPTKPQTKKSKQKMSPLSKYFVNEIANDDNGIDNEIFKQDFGHLNPSFLAKNLLKTNQAENKPMLNQANYVLIKKKFLQMKIMIKQSILLRKFLIF